MTIEERVEKLRSSVLAKMAAEEQQARAEATAEAERRKRAAEVPHIAAQFNLRVDRAMEFAHGVIEGLPYQILDSSRTAGHETGLQLTRRFVCRKNGTTYRERELWIFVSDEGAAWMEIHSAGAGKEFSSEARDAEKVDDDYLKLWFMSYLERVTRPVS